MNRYLEPAPKREVSESAFELILGQAVDYFLHGHGGRAFRPAEETKLGMDASDRATALSATRRRLEALGQDVGMRLVERYVMERDRMDTDLEVVKFICKDFWELTFKKQVDTLRTNHRGLYVLTDNNFRWMAKVSKNSDDHPGVPEDYLVFPCGLICGALTRLGVKCRVTAEMSANSAVYKCSFSVQVISN